MITAPPAFTPRMAGATGPKPGEGFQAFPLTETDQSIASRFRAQVARNPDALAIKEGTRSLNYRELDAQTNRIAHAILAIAPQTTSPVALLLEAGMIQVVGLLGVLKAGYFFVPVDPSLPTARISDILEDTAPALLIACNATQKQAHAVGGDNTVILNLDTLDEGLPVSDPDIDIFPDALAYVLYTSGTTGRPKGVVQNQRNVLHAVMRYTNILLIGCGDRQTLLYSYSVFGGTRDIFNALLNGASLHVYPVVQHGVAGLAKWLWQERINIYCSVPTVFRHFLKTFTLPVSFPDLRLIKLGGEATYFRDIEQLRPLLQGGCVVHCGLGTTETGLVRTYWVNHDTQIGSPSVPLGYEVEGMEVLLLDESGQPVPRGEVGEIVVHSPYLALGYWGDEQLSRACFSISGDNPELRRYRTGDLGVMNADGCIEHRGRKDFRVKIRGNRVELAEVEQSLLGLPEVGEAVVLPKLDAQGENRLVAYVVAKPGRACSLPAIRRTLGERLPSFMLPEAIVVLSAFPQLANGKINREALPEPVFQISRQNQAYVPAHTPFEHELVRLWEETLNLEGVGIDDNFFELGGHSLLAVQLMERIHEAFGRKLHLNTLWYGAGSVAQQARLLTDMPGGVGSTGPVLVMRAGEDAPALFCLHTIGGGNLFHYEPLVRNLKGDRPVYGLQARGIDGNEAPDTSVEAMAHYCIQSMRNIQPSGPYFLCGFSSGGLVAYEMARCLTHEGCEATLFLLDSVISSQTGSLSNYWSRWSRLIKQKRIREMQERIYHTVLSYFGLSRLRALRGLGESHRWAVWSYRPQSCALSAHYFEASEQIVGRVRGSTGWLPILKGGLTLHRVPGTHDAIVKDDNVAILADKLSEYFPL